MVTNIYYFVLASPAKEDISSPYKLFIYDKSKKINLDKINPPLQTEIEKANEFNLMEYINKFEVKKSKMPTKKPKLTIVPPTPSVPVPTLSSPVPTISVPVLKPSVPAQTEKVSIDSDEELDEEKLIEALEEVQDKPLIKK